MVEKKDEAEYFNLGISLSIYIFFPTPALPVVIIALVLHVLLSYHVSVGKMMQYTLILYSYGTFS